MPLVTVENDDNVTILVKNLCARVAHTSLTDDIIPIAISALEKVGMDSVTIHWFPTVGARAVAAFFINIISLLFPCSPSSVACGKFV